jgi:hypothetical protein
MSSRVQNLDERGCERYIRRDRRRDAEQEEDELERQRQVLRSQNTTHRAHCKLNNGVARDKTDTTR